MWVGNNLKEIMMGRLCNSPVVEKSKIMRSQIGFSLTLSFNDCKAMFIGRKSKKINFNICYYGLY